MKDKADKKKNLRQTHPELAKQWHPTKNGDLRPEDFTYGSNKKVWWKCDKGDDHEWDASVLSRSKGRGCAVCGGVKVVLSNSLATTHPELAKQWHPTKNGDLRPKDVTHGSNKKVWWKCPEGDDHEWDASLISRSQGSSRSKGRGCAVCGGKKVVLSNSLATTHPELAKQCHPTKNGDLRLEDFTHGSNKKVWWKCPEGDDHEWEASIRTRSKGSGCAVCAGQKVVLSNSLATTHPELAKQWHPTKNGDLRPEDVIPGSGKKVWWKCPEGDDHEWEASVKSRSKGSGCGVCAGVKVVPSNSLALTHPELAKEWHPIKNGILTALDVIPGSSKRVWWKCPEGDDHEWEEIVGCRKKTGCPLCSNGLWTVKKLRLFLKSLGEHIHQLTPAERFVIFQQNGLLNIKGKCKSFVKLLQTGKFPKEELDKFVNEEAGLAEKLISDEAVKIEDNVENSENLLDEAHCISENDIDMSDEELPVVETKDILSSFSNKVTANIDTEAMEFLLNSGTAKIWAHIFIDEDTALKQLEDDNSNSVYSCEVKKRFMEQYNGAVNLSIPAGYNFKLNGEICLPNLMQRFTAFMVKKAKRFGNWSGTGAGKTLSAILASRVIDAKLTIICCPNSVVTGWKETIEAIYPDSIVVTKDLTVTSSDNLPQYIILNYEFFQQKNSEIKLKDFLKTVKVDFVVIDEIHFSKQREEKKMSKRKKVITAMLSEANTHNENLHVLGMSATPVINNLFEGKTLIELITGYNHDDLKTHPNVGNCMSLYQKFVSQGVRWMPKYKQNLNVNKIEVDCSKFIEEIKSVSINGTRVDVEAVLTKAKIPEILKNLKPKTIVYTYYIKNILSSLEEAIQDAGWKTAIYSGDDKRGLQEFLRGDAEVLIATSCIGTGVDGLQNVCDRIIINILPWTNAEFEQLKGRIYRQGQQSDNVDIIIPLTYAFVGGGRWSYCESRWEGIHFKKSLADSAVDGVIPEGHLRTPDQAYKDSMKWLARLENGEVNEIERRKIDLCLSGEQQKVAFRKYGDFSKMNRQFNVSSSSLTNQRLSQNPEEWEHYHSLYRDARKDWPVVPFNEAIKWCKARPHLMVGDFGCGEALLAKEVENKVYSFDHVAINDDVIACDIAHVPLDDECLDAAIFSLSLMGTNYMDYIKEAHRCLKLDGDLWIAEATSRYENLSSLEEELTKIGFDVLRNQKKGNFTFLRLIKSDRH